MNYRDCSTIYSTELPSLQNQTPFLHGFLSFGGGNNLLRFEKKFSNLRRSKPLLCSFSKNEIRPFNRHFPSEIYTPLIWCCFPRGTATPGPTGSQRIGGRILFLIKPGKGAAAVSKRHSGYANSRPYCFSEKILPSLAISLP